MTSGGSTEAAEPDCRWLISIWVLVAGFIAVTAVWSQHVGVPWRDPGGEVFRSRIAISLGLFAVLIVLDAVRRTRGTVRSVNTVIAAVRSKWTRLRLALALSGLLAYHIVYACYHNLKSWDVFNALRDQELLRADRWLFFGHSPAVLLHQVLGEHTAAYLLMVLYESFSSIVSVSFVAALVFADRIRAGYVFLASSLWVWILGVGSYYLIPSLGPFASAPQEFARLPHTMVTDTQARYLAQRDYLLQHPSASDAFAQVSAFASLHVGFTALIVLMLRYYGFRRATRVMAAYLVGTIIATVYLGWHYALDDVAGLVLAYLAVRFGRLMIYPGGGGGGGGGGKAETSSAQPLVASSASS